MPSERSSRLAAYATAATGAICAGTQADIQVYDGPAIPIDLDGVTLTLPGLQLDLGVATRTFLGSTSFSWWTCCSSTGGPSCQWSDLVVQRSTYQSRILSVFNAGGVSTIDFLDLGKAVEGLEGQADSTLACRSNERRIFGCGDNSTMAQGNCDEVRTMHLGFTAPKDGDTVHGWAEIERAANGLYRITRWAYQDDGSPILTGQVPAATCTADLDGSGTVDSGDLGVLLAAWGNCGKKGDCPADLDGNRTVDSADLGSLLAAWGSCPADSCDGVECSSDDPCELVACIDGVCYVERLRSGDCGAFDCCEVHPEPGCASDACMDDVCFFAPPCCTDTWDDFCVQLASAFCDECP